MERSTNCCLKPLANLGMQPNSGVRCRDFLDTTFEVLPGHVGCSRKGVGGSSIGMCHDDMMLTWALNVFEANYILYRSY